MSACTRTIAVVTGTRAEFGLLQPVMRAIEATDGLALQTIVTGTHLTRNTWCDIDDAGFVISARVPMQHGEDVGRAADGWDFVDEAQTDPDNDPDLRRWGVRSRRVRYYSRLHDGRIESCSVEIWRFKDLQGAEAAERGFGYPDWRVEREGDALLMLHGQALQRGRPAERGVGPDCARIGRAIRSNIHLR